MNIDESFRQHQSGAISATFTSDWYLRKDKSRNKMGEWLKKTTVRSQDQRRMLQPNTHSFPSNYWRHKITKGKETNRCDLCRSLWITEGRFNTEDDLPIQTLGHVQHQCETLSEIHTLVHHRFWRIIHTELGRLTSSKWQFICIMTETEQERLKVGISKETIVVERIWKKRPDGFPIKISIETKEGELVILEFKRTSCVTDRTGEKCSDSPIRIHKISTRTNTPPPRMDCDPEKFHNRGKVSKRERFTRHTSFRQGPGRRHRIH
jgi:hypothetical protein